MNRGTMSQAALAQMLRAWTARHGSPAQKGLALNPLGPTISQAASINRTLLYSGSFTPAATSFSFSVSATAGKLIVFVPVWAAAPPWSRNIFYTIGINNYFHLRQTQYSDSFMWAFLGVFSYLPVATGPLTITAQTGSSASAVLAMLAWQINGLASSAADKGAVNAGSSASWATGSSGTLSEAAEYAQLAFLQGLTASPPNWSVGNRGTELSVTLANGHTAYLFDGYAVTNATTAVQGQLGSMPNQAYNGLVQTWY